MALRRRHGKPVTAFQGDEQHGIVKVPSFHPIVTSESPRRGQFWDGLAPPSGRPARALFQAGIDRAPLERAFEATNYATVGAVKGPKWTPDKVSGVSCIHVACKRMWP
jgi:hypothetical protein